MKQPSALWGCRSLVAALGNCCPRSSETAPNDLSVHIVDGALRAARALQVKSGPVALLALGGNGGRGMGRRPRATGRGLTEAQRLLSVARARLQPGDRIVLCCDCDDAFLEAFAPLGVRPSTDTSENLANVRAVLRACREIRELTIVAHQLHMPRAWGVAQRELAEQLPRVTAHYLATPGRFELDNDQLHTRHPVLWWPRELAARIHHLMTGRVPRRRFVHQWLSGWPDWRRDHL